MILWILGAGVYLVAMLFVMIVRNTRTIKVVEFVVPMALVLALLLIGSYAEHSTMPLTSVLWDVGLWSYGTIVLASLRLAEDPGDVTTFD